jgi:predicted MFS family arabinose efflux permease
MHPQGGGSSSAAAEWRRDWTLVLAAAIGFSFMSAMHPIAGIFMGPLEQEFGWNRTELSAGLALSPIIAILLSPFVGALIDRVGIRRLALPGIVLTSAAVAAFGLMSGSVMQWVLLWVIFGLCSLTISSTLWATAVSSVFVEGRGLALGVTLAGTALAQVIAPPLSNELIETIGWRGAYVALGFGWGGLAFVLAVLFLADGRSAQDRSRKAARGGSSSPTVPGLSIPEAWRSSELWRLATATFLILTITIAVTVHQFPIIVEAGVSRSTAAWLVSLGGVAGIVGKLVTGTLIDRFHARWVGGITLASTAVAYPLLVEPLATPLLIVIGIMISGYAAGTKIQLCGYLTSRYAGLRNYGTIFGVMTSAISLSATVGPLLAGLSRDHFGTYAPMMYTGVVLSLISGALIFTLPRYPDWSPRTRGGHKGVV